jgi:carboxymethylenebutenolidase
MLNRRGMLFAAACCLIAPALVRADVKTTDLKLKSGDSEFKAVLAMPDGPGPFPAVVVIQEWWGLTDWITANAKRFAELGYVAIAPDLYHGQATDNPSVATQLMRGMPQDRALRDLKTCVDELSNNPKVNKDKIGCVGWCMGGGLSLQASLNDPRIIACAVCYGRLSARADSLKPLKAAVLGIFGEQDQGIPIGTVRMFEQAAKEAGKTVEGIHMYPAGHGFMRPGAADKPNAAYNEESTKDAWKQIDAFFAKYLGGKA